MASSTTDRLCSRCADIDFGFFTEPFQNAQEMEPPADISWSVLHPEDCQFCELLLHSVHNGQATPADERLLQLSLRGVYARHELQLYVDDKETSKRLDYSIRHCESMPLELPEEAPQKLEYFDVKELKFWLDQCKTHECLPRHHSQNPLPDGLRLIDVQQNCIVQPKIHVDYCVLSYVWGDIRQPSLTSHSTLEEQKSLEALDLPRTILDAMSLCRDIGIDFLWVDSLCIVQDSADDKHRQILTMADVYSQSFLAIVAAAGDDANAGLRPYGSLGRKSNLSYLARRSSKGGFVASPSPQIAAEEIAKSTWASRGWTLQEYALSRRVLFFTGSYTFLRCENGLRCEDFGLGFSNCIRENRKWDLPLPPFYRRASETDDHYSSTFSQMLSEFVRRNLRYDEDVLSAFTGILTRMEHSIGKHIWGLPSKEFGAALQWTTNLPFPTVARAGFPSWSWAGWIHANDFSGSNGSFPSMYEGFNSKAADMSVLTCHKIGDDNSVQNFGECNIQRIISQFKREAQIHQFPADATEIARLERGLQRYFAPPQCQELHIQNYVKQQRDPSEPPLSHHIFLWASHASLFVDRLPKNTPRPVAVDFSIRVREGSRPIGSIRLNSEWRDAEPDYMEFFVSTVGVHSSTDTVPSAVQLKFKVILIQLCQGTEMPVYKRIQVSHTSICRTDWMLARPESQLIALV